MNISKFVGAMIAVASMPLATYSPIAFSQEAAALEEVVVTARKREQSIQDTPIAISAFDSQEIESAGYENIIDVSKAAPGFFIETINSNNARVDAAPRFRGVTFESTSPLQRTGSIFIDGVLVSGGIQSINVQDLERVEIIKGPQSALFGRNTYSGAINYVTRTPGTEFGADIGMTIATEGEHRFEGSIEGPLFGDAVRGRLGGSISQKDGHYENAIVPGQMLGTESSWSVGGALVIEPNDNFQLRVRADVYEDHDGPAAVIRTAGFAEHNFGGFPLPGGGTTETAYQGTVRIPSGDDVGLNTDQGFYDTITSLVMPGGQFIDLDFGDLGGPGLLREGYRVGVGATIDFDNGMALDVLGGVNEDEWLLYSDFDSTPGNGFITTGGREAKDTSIEARLSGNGMDDRLAWSVGTNYVEIEVEGVGGFYDPVLGFWFPGIFNDRFLTGAKTTGFFGTVDYSFTDSFTLILEARYQEDEIRDDNVNDGLATPISPTTFESFLPRILLQWEPNDDTMVYFNYSLGNLPGGFNQEVGELDANQRAEFDALVPGVGTTYDEETLENFEVGLKRTSLDGRLAYNVAAFFMERTDQIYSGFEVVSDPMNVNGVRTVAYTTNGATSDILGMELEAAWNVNERFSLNGSLAYVDATIDSFPPGANSGDFTAVFGPDADVSGQRSPRYPEWAGSLSGEYVVPVSTFGTSDWYTRADIFYTGDFWDENTNLAKIPSATDVNLRTGIRNEIMTLELFVTNLFEEDSPAAGNNIADTSLDVRFGSSLFDFSQESVHVALRDKRQIGMRFYLSF